jgi:type I restriction enzyme S subunit
MVFYRETEFQETPIGKIPSDWTVIKLEEVLHLRNGERPKISDGGDVPIFGANGIMGYTNDVLVDNEFTIVVGRVGASGQVHLGEGKIWVSDNAIYSENYDKTRAHPPFLFYLLRYRKLDQFASKTTHPIITQTFLNNFLIHVPPLEEQKRIVGVLGVVDSVIAKTGEVIAKTERLKKGLMQTLLTRGIGHKEYKQTPIGTTPKTWQIVSIGDVCEQRNEIVQPSVNNKETFVGLEHISSGETRLHNFAQSADVKSAKFRFYAGDILYGKLRPYLDKAVIADFNGICSTDLLVLTPKENVVKEFLIYILHSDDFIKHAIATTTGTNHPRTSWSAISKFKFGLPERSEQKNIAKTLTAVDMKLELEKKEKARLERIKAGLMDFLLTGKIRVKVD